MRFAAAARIKPIKKCDNAPLRAGHFWRRRLHFDFILEMQRLGGGTVILLYIQIVAAMSHHTET
jgi:hypothetical protein